jgi:catechol-2,3-dioxygenase
VATADFYAQVFGVPAGTPRGHAVLLRLSPAIELHLEEAETYTTNHYAFRVGLAEFDQKVERVKTLGIPFGTASATKNGEVKVRPDSQSIYFADPAGHDLEFIAYR